MTQNAKRRLGAAAIGLVVLLDGGSSAVFARVVKVTDCAGGNAIRKATRYILTADIDCTGQSDPVLLLVGGVLELRGYTLSNGDVLCSGKCRILGPGRINGGGVIGNGKVTVLRTTITGSPSNGVLAINARGNARATIIDSVVSGNAMTGVEADRKTTIIRSRIIGNGRHGVAVSLQPLNNCKRGRIRSLVSEVSGNGRNVACGISEACADVATCTHRYVSLRGTGCDTSYELGSGMPGRSCSVCALD